jgi:hypothetical protein
MPDGRKPGHGGCERMGLLVEDIEAEVERLKTAGLNFRNDIVSDPEGKQVVRRTSMGQNPIELFQPAVP